jgi:hypothetical protein
MVTSISNKTPKLAEAVTFGNDEWRAVVQGQLQKPIFNSKGAALIFAQQVFTKLRKAEPVTD